MTRRNHARKMARFAWLRGVYLVLGLAVAVAGLMLVGLAYVFSRPS